MEFVDSMLKKAMDLLEVGREKISNIFINDEIAKAAMVVAAWVTVADGEIKESEIAETEKFIQEFEFFEKFNKDKLKKEYREWCDKFMDDFQDAVLDALIEISSLKDTDEALPVLKLAVRIAKSDQDCSTKERKVVAKIAYYLGMDAHCHCDDEEV